MQFWNLIVGRMVRFGCHSLGRMVIFVGLVESPGNGEFKGTMVKLAWQGRK